MSKTADLSPRSRLSTFWCAAFIVAAGTATYWNALSAPFVLDDQLSVLYNRSIRQLWPAARVLFAEQDLPTSGRPIVNISFAINYALGGFQVRGYHVFNLVIHLLCALLVLGVVRRTLELPRLRPRFGRASIALGFATALIWMVHPLSSEVVDYVTQRSESMMALFFLLTLYCGIRARGSARVAVWQATAVASCALGMACKESMVTAPLVVVLYDRVFVFASFREALRDRWRFYAGLAGTWLVLAALVSASPRGTSAGFRSGVTAWTYLLNQAVIITHYLRLTVWPRSLVALYGWPLPLTLGEVMLQASLIAGLLLLTMAALIRKPEIGFLGAWFFITLAPTSSVVPIATEVGAERRMYLPLMAVVVLAVIGSRWLWDRARGWRHGWALTIAVVSVALAARTVVRNREYQSPLSLARTIVERWPTATSYQTLGAALLEAGHPEEAEAPLRAAIAGAPVARNILGILLFNQGRLDEAVEQLDAFVRIWESPPAHHPFWQPPVRLEVVEARQIMGRAFARQQRWPEAIAQFKRVLAMTPGHVEARHALAEVLFTQKEFGDATALYKEYVQQRPDDWEAWTNLAISLLATDKTADALVAFRRAVAIAPANGRAQRNLANALLDYGDAAEAVDHAREAARLRPDDPEARDLLVRALAAEQAGRR